MEPLKISVDPALLNPTILEFTIPNAYNMGEMRLDDTHKAVQSLVTLIYALLYNGVSLYEIQQRLVNPATEE